MRARDPYQLLQRYDKAAGQCPLGRRHRVIVKVTDDADARVPVIHAVLDTVRTGFGHHPAAQNRIGGADKLEAEMVADIIPG